jgi:hypothetical protein
VRLIYDFIVGNQRLFIMNELCVVARMGHGGIEWEGRGREGRRLEEAELGRSWMEECGELMDNYRVKEVYSWLQDMRTICIWKCE